VGNARPNTPNFILFHVAIQYLTNKYPVVGDGSGFSQTDQFYREELQPIAATWSSLA
jgi:hypothetical protein